MKAKRLFCVLLATFLLLSITGCGLTFQGNDNMTSPANNKGVYANYS